MNWSMNFFLLFTFQMGFWMWIFFYYFVGRLVEYYSENWLIGKQNEMEFFFCREETKKNGVNKFFGCRPESIKRRCKTDFFCCYAVGR